MPGTTAPEPPSLTRPIRVGVVEDDARSRQSFTGMIRAQPDFALVLVAATRLEALQLLPRQELDVLLVDLGLPDGSGLDIIRAAKQVCPRCAVLVSTIFGDDTHVLRSIEAGAMGYLLKDSDAYELATEIRSIHAGGSPISPMVARKILARAAAMLPGKPLAAASTETGEPVVALSARESEVLKYVSKGFTTEETAAVMGISSSTVLTFVRRIYAKLQVNSRAEAIHEAHRKGLLAD